MCLECIPKVLEARLVTTRTLGITASAPLIDVVRSGGVRGCLGILDGAYDERCGCFCASRHREQPNFRFEDAFGLAPGCRQVVTEDVNALGRLFLGALFNSGRWKGVI